jgi:RNA polymerase sigma factor (sigma-70 family)
MNGSPATGIASALAGPAMRSQSERRLVRLVREGHDQAFEEIDRRYRARLTAYAGSFVKSGAAEDVVQDALLRACLALRAGNEEVRLRPWLYRIVRNTALNHLRDAPPPHEELDSQYDGVPQPPDIVAQREELGEVVRSIKGLPVPLREALVQRELEGRSHGEIGRSLGITPAAARQLIFRARRAAREGLGALLPLPVLRYLLAGDATGAGLGVAGGGGAAFGALKIAAIVAALGGGVITGAVVRDTAHHGHARMTAQASPTAAPVAKASAPATAPRGRTASGRGSGPRDTGIAPAPSRRSSESRSGSSSSDSSGDSGDSGHDVSGSNDSGDSSSSGDLSSGSGSDGSGSGSSVGSGDGGSSGGDSSSGSSGSDGGGSGDIGQTSDG